MCSTGPSQYRWSKGYIYSSCYYHHQIGSIHLSHCYHIFPWLCAWDVCYITFCHLLHIHSEKNREFVFIIIVQFMMTANSRIRFGLQIVFVCLYSTPPHYHHCANLSEDIELKNACHIYFVECVSKITHILSGIHYTMCGAVCFQFSLCDDWVYPLWWLKEYIYFVLLTIIIKSEEWTITHCLELGHETIVCAVCLSIIVSTH